MLVLVRKDVQTEDDRGKHGTALRSSPRVHPNHGLPEMVDYRSVNHPSQPKRHPTGSFVHLPPQEIQHGRPWQEGKRVPVDDHCFDDGKQM
jgi:hypothetical protein